MISETFPHNAMQKKLLQRRLFRGIINVFCVLGVVVAMLLTLPTQSFAATIVNETFSGDYTNARQFTSSGGALTSAVKWTATGSYNQSVTSVSLRMGREGASATSCSIAMDVYVSGVDPYPDGIFLRRSASQDFNTLSTSTSGAGGGMKAFDFSADPFTMFPDSVYYFEPYKFGTGCNKEGYIFNKGATAQLHRLWHFFLGDWTESGNVTYLTIVADQGDFNPSGSEYLLTELTSSPYEAGDTVEFELSWSNFLAFDGDIKHIEFQPLQGSDGTDPCVDDCSYLQVLYDSSSTPLSSQTGSILVSYTYNFAGDYIPFVAFRECSTAERLGNDETWESTNCERYVVEAATVTVTGTPDDDQTYTNVLDFPYKSTRTISELQDFDWTVDSGTCGGALSVTGQKIFKGYPDGGNLAAADVGQELSGSSGTGAISYSVYSTDLGKSFYPYIRVYCSDGSSVKLYNGSTLYAFRAIGLWIQPSNFNNPAAIGYGDKGGYSQDFDSISGSGAYFLTDKDIYQRKENVRITYYYDVQFSVDTVLFYPDIEEYPSLTVELTDILDRIERSFNYQYEEQGRYFPMIEVRSASYSAGDPTTFRRIWLGGNQVKEASRYLEVLSTVYSASNFRSTRGVFGLNPNTFEVNFGDSGNPFLVLAGGVVTYTVKGALYIASFLYALLEYAPFFNFFTEVIAPDPNKVYTLQESLCFVNDVCMELPVDSLPNKTFAIAYATDEAAEPYFFLLLFGLSLSTITLFSRKFFA